MSSQNAKAEARNWEILRWHTPDATYINLAGPQQLIQPQINPRDYSIPSSKFGQNTSVLMAIKLKV
jgi:hypothetical protein